MTDVEENVEKKIKTLNDLNGITPTTMNKLIEAGYASIEALAVATPQDISVAAGIPLTTAQRIIREAREALGVYASRRPQS